MSRSQRDRYQHAVGVVRYREQSRRKEVSNATQSSGGDVGREPTELRNMVNGQAGI